MFENCGNEVTKVRWNQMSGTLSLSWLKGFRVISWAFGQFWDIWVCALSTDSACAVGSGASGRLGAEADASFVEP